MAKRLEVRVVKLEDGQSTIMSQLAKMDQTLVGIDHVIRGNGGPGLSTRVELQGQAIRDLKAARKGWKDFLVLVVSGGLIAALTALLQHFAR